MYKSKTYVVGLEVVGINGVGFEVVGINGVGDVVVGSFVVGGFVIAEGAILLSKHQYKHYINIIIYKHTL